MGFIQEWLVFNWLDWFLEFAEVQKFARKFSYCLNLSVLTKLHRIQQYWNPGFQTIVKYLIHCVVTLVGYIGTKNEEGWYFGTLSTWAFYVSNQSDVSNSDRHRRRNRRQRLAPRRRPRRLQRNKTKQATGSTRCDCAPWGSFFNYVDHFFLLLTIYVPTPGLHCKGISSLLLRVPLLTFPVPSIF